MPSQLTSGTWRPELEGAVREYAATDAARRQFIGDIVLPIQREATKVGQFPVLCKENWRKLIDTSRAPNGAFNRGDFDWKFTNYACVENGIEEPVDNSTVAQFADVLRLEEEAAIGADYIIRLRHEKAVSDAVMNITTFTATNVAVDWDTVATSTPLVDLDAGVNTLEDQLGVPRQALSLILPRSKWQALRRATTVLATLQSWSSGISGPESIRLGVVKDYLDVKEIIVGTGSYDSADEGLTQSFSQIWPSRYGMLALLAPGEAAPRQTLCLGRTVSWTWPSSADVSIETYDSMEIDARVVRARQFTQEFIQSSFAGYLMDLDALS